MDRYDHMIYENVQISKKTKLNDFLSKFMEVHARRLLLIIFSFFISRLSINGMSPMIIAYYGIVYLDQPCRIWLFFVTLIGLGITLPVFAFVKYLLIIVLFIALTTYMELRGKSLTLVKNTMIISISALGIGVVSSLLQVNRELEILLALLESLIILTLSFVYAKSVMHILYRTKTKLLSNELIISLGVLMATLVAGAASLEVIDYAFKEMILFTTVLYFGYCYGIGIGSVVGLMSGFVLTIMGYYDPAFLGVFGIIGILSGVFRDLGKLGSAIGFVLGTILLGYYFTPDLLTYDLLKALGSSMVIFLFMPKQFLRKAENKNIAISNEYYKEKIQKLTKDKLNHFADSFNKLAHTFRAISEKRTSLSHQEVTQIFDEVAEKVCKNCSMCKLCWEKEFYDTYKAAFSILGAAEKKGAIQRSDVPKEFMDKCIKLDEFVMMSNRLFELFKINLSWHNRIVESRELVSEQLNGVATIIDKFSNEIYAHIDEEKKLEEQMIEELKKRRIEVKNILVTKGKQNKRKEVEITMKTGNNKSYATKDLIPIINKLIQKKMKLADGSRSTIDGSYSTFKYIEDKMFRSLQGIARITKEGESVSGDHFSFIELTTGQTILALSDGMGTGLRACRESEAAINLLEQFMEAGFDKQIAIKLINSVLVLKSNDHSFSTMDMSVVDMYTGLCEFIKIGAAPTFIKRRDSIETIKSTSLPVGVFNNVDFEMTTRKLYEGDIIVMVTDGIIDAENNVIDKERWVEDALSEINSKNPQEIAEYILEKAKEKSGEKVADDMTVLVSRIWKK